MKNAPSPTVLGLSFRFWSHLGPSCVCRGGALSTDCLHVCTQLLGRCVYVDITPGEVYMGY